MATIIEVLDSTEVARVRDLMETAPFIPGRMTARGAAAEVKNNLQATPSADLAECESVVCQALMRSSEFSHLALPARMSQPIFSRYDVGMGYGRHYDSARVGGIRADVSVTLFLSEPQEYDGGELVVEDEGFRLRAGFAVVYPSGAFHEVAEVTRGTRLASVLWVESHVRDEGQRSLLRDLASLSERVPAEAMEIGRIRADLYRRWG